MGDRVRLQQVLMNLMINSIDAMKDVDGTRELTIQSQLGEDGHVLISVSDTGVGLPPQLADKIFNAFFTTKTHGTGMGLRISRSIVESHWGRLWAADNSRAAQGSVHPAHRHGRRPFNLNVLQRICDTSRASSGFQMQSMITSVWRRMRRHDRRCGNDTRWPTWRTNLYPARQLFAFLSDAPIYSSLAYSDFAAMRIGMFGSASFHSAKKSW